MSSGDGGGALNSEQCGENMSESHTRVHTSAAVDSFRKESAEERVCSHVFVLFYCIVCLLCELPTSTCTHGDPPLLRPPHKQYTRATYP